MTFLRLCLLPLLFLAACSPEPATGEKSTVSPHPGSAGGEAAKALVPFAKLGWAENKFTWEGQPFTGNAEEYYRNTTQLKLRYGIKNGVYHGLVEEWYPSGQKKTQTSYEEGQHQGDNFYWNSDGSLQVHKVWKDNQLISETPGERKP